MQELDRSAKGSPPRDGPPLIKEEFYGLAADALIGVIEEVFEPVDALRRCQLSEDCQNPRPAAPARSALVAMTWMFLLRVRSGYTMRDLEECLGESHHKIQRWIANGWLRDTLQGTRRHDGSGRDIHRFREKDILDFIREYPLEVNLGRLDAVWFLDMILLKGREASVRGSRGGAEADGEAA